MLGIAFGAQAQQCDPNQLDNMPTSRFVIHDNGTVTDRVTGLDWQRCAVGQTWDGQTCAEDLKKQVRSWFSWNDAHRVVARLPEAMKREGWRMPTVQELRTLLARHCTDPAINTEVFPNAPSWFFWSDTEYKENPDYAWQVDFNTGETNAHLKVSVSYHLRLVRGSLLPTSKKRNPGEQASEALLSVWDDGIHDVDNPDLGLLQRPDESTRELPRDTRGQVDWAKSLLEGDIAPRATRRGDGEMVVWDQDILFKETAHMPYVRFPHKLHSMWLACENCHDQIFPAKQGAVDISMAAIYQGQYCGVCHGKVAFTPNSCERCHSVLHAGSPKKWW